MKKNKKLTVEESLIISLKEAKLFEDGSLALRSQLRHLPDPAPRLTKNEILGIRKMLKVT